MTARKKTEDQPPADGAKGYAFAPGSKQERPDAADTKPGSPPPEGAGGLKPVVLAPGRKKAEKEKRKALKAAPQSDETRPGTEPLPGAVEREERRNCSFPGLMKVIFPEQSFLPVPFAVRVANLSPRGAMVELHDSAKLDKDVVLVDRFFELKVAHQQLPTVRGTVAWADLSKESPQFGLAFYEYCEEVEELLADLGSLTDSGSTGEEGPPPLPMPVLDTFSGVALDTRHLISGRAPEALEVRVRGEDKVFKAPVKDGRFELELTLEPGGKNFFHLRSVAGKRRSKSLPIRIECESKARRAGNVFDLRREEDKGGRARVRLAFHGSPAEAERVLYRLSQLMAQSERMHFSANLEAPGAFDRALLEALEAERESIINNKK